MLDWLSVLFLLYQLLFTSSFILYLHLLHGFALGLLNEFKIDLFTRGAHNASTMECRALELSRKSTQIIFQYITSYNITWRAVPVRRGTCVNATHLRPKVAAAAAADAAPNDLPHASQLSQITHLSLVLFCILLFLKDYKDAISV